MARDPRHDILFEPVKIGPVTAPNRFYQVPHCNGMGYRDPSGMVELRRIKAEGGWGVVCTEQAEIHHSSEITPFIEIRLWDDRDLPPLASMCEAVHGEGALAGIELAYNGMNGPNFYSREIPMGPSHLPIITFSNDPVQARAMDKADIADLRRWHRNAALRARKAGFDIVYVYAAHGFGAPQHFLSRRYNRRTDEYGGSVGNRSRLLRELIEDTKEVVGHECAVAVRISMDELIGEAGLQHGEVEEIIGHMAELPDLWDLTLSGWENDSRTSRFADEAAQEPFVRRIKAITSKPVVGVGRFTSPDAMARQIERGILDLIGAARPSIADPFLPMKIDQGRTDEIRECIGCNICVSGDMTMSPIRCTQNPTMGEEWRRGWHPEQIPPPGSTSRVLVIGSGPAGLEAARALGQRGYEVKLAEAGEEPGGRISRESRLPGLAAWARVRDHRLHLLNDLPNVETYYDSELSASQVLEFGFEHVAVATGARWRRDGIARFRQEPIPIADGAAVLTPDDLMDGGRPTGSVVIYDDDHYYMGSVLAELLVKEGCAVTFVTPAAEVASWSRNTLEQTAIQTRLLEFGVEILPHRAVTEIRRDSVETSCVFTGRNGAYGCDAVVLVTARLPNEALYRDLRNRRDDWQDAGIQSVKAIGDALAPGLIAAAVYAGHRYARELDADVPLDEPPFRRELAEMLQE